MTLNMRRNAYVVPWCCYFPQHSMEEKHNYSRSAIDIVHVVHNACAKNVLRGAKGAAAKQSRFAVPKAPWWANHICLFR